MKIKSRSFCLKLSLNLLCFYFLGCSSSNEQGITSFDIPKEAQPNFPLSEIAKSIEYISLETSDESFLSLIQEVKLCKNKIYVLDVIGKFLVFETNGKFLYQIGTKGEGPGEFLYLSSFALDEKSDRLYLASDRRLITYTLDNEYVSEKSFPYFIDYVEIIDNQLVIIAGRDGKKVGDKFVNERSLFKVNPELDLIDSIPLLYIEMNKQTGAIFPFKNYISKVDGDNFIYTPVLTNESIMRDTLFRIENSTLMPAIKLNFALPAFSKEGNKLIVIKNVFISKKYILCEYDREGSVFFYIKNIKSDFSINLDQGFSIENEEKIILRPLDLENNRFYFIKTYNFSNISTEELNPMIGIVKL
jgi:hypothetical protein